MTRTRVVLAGGAVAAAIFLLLSGQITIPGGNDEEGPQWTNRRTKAGVNDKIVTYELYIGFRSGADRTVTISGQFGPQGYRHTLQLADMETFREQAVMRTGEIVNLTAVVSGSGRWELISCAAKIAGVPIGLPVTLESPPLTGSEPCVLRAAVP